MLSYRLSPWYLNTRRLAVLTGTAIPIAAQVSLNQNSGERASAMRYATSVAETLLKSGRIPILTRELLRKHAGVRSFTAAIWDVFTFRGVTNALMKEHDGKRFDQGSFSATVSAGVAEFHLYGRLSNDHIYSTTSTEYLSGRKRAYVMGQFDVQDTNLLVSPFIIGDFVADATDLPFEVQDWPRHARLHPMQIDQFSELERIRTPSLPQLKSLLAVDEETVKYAFASIIGEPFVPKDWGGEKSDLSSSRIHVDGKPLSAAFIFKGPSVPGELHPANMGKRGDQLARAFEEPVDLVVIQHCNKIANSVVRQAEAFAADPGHPRMYCTIDGADTYRILKAYKKLK